MLLHNPVNMECSVSKLEQL